MCLLVLDVYVYDVLLGTGQTETNNKKQLNCVQFQDVKRAFLVSNADGFQVRAVLYSR